MTKHLFILTLVFGLGLSVHAQTGNFKNIHQNYHSVRVAGMGGAFAAVANDESAIFYNPAALARFTEGKMQGVLIDGNISTGFDNFYRGLMAASSSADPTAFLNSMIGQYFSGRVKLFEASWVRPNWGFAIIPVDVSADFSFENSTQSNAPWPISASPPFNFRYFADTTIALSYANTIKNESLGLLNWGLTLKAVGRQYASKQVTAKSILDSGGKILSANEQTDGVTTDVDFGLLFTPYMPEDWNFMRAMRPTIGFVGRNLIDGDFSSPIINKSATVKPDKLYRVYDVGLRLEIPQFWIFGGRFALDQRDIGHPNYNERRALHTGFEFDWTVTNWWKGQWRVGMGQGYSSFGFSALFSVLRLDLATFGEDVGTVSTPRENRIYQIKMSGEF